MITGLTPATASQFPPNDQSVHVQGTERLPVVAQWAPQSVCTMWTVVIWMSRSSPILVPTVSGLGAFEEETTKLKRPVLKLMRFFLSILASLKRDKRAKNGHRVGWYTAEQVGCCRKRLSSLQKQQHQPFDCLTFKWQSRKGRSSVMLVYHLNKSRSEWMVGCEMRHRRPWIISHLLPTVYIGFFAP